MASLQCRPQPGQQAPGSREGNSLPGCAGSPVNGRRCTAPRRAGTAHCTLPTALGPPSALPSATTPRCWRAAAGVPREPHGLRCKVAAPPRPATPRHAPPPRRSAPRGVHPCRGVPCRAQRPAAVHSAKCIAPLRLADAPRGWLDAASSARARRPGPAHSSGGIAPAARSCISRCTASAPE